MHEADAGMDDMFTWLQQWYEQQRRKAAISVKLEASSGS